MPTIIRKKKRLHDKGTNGASTIAVKTQQAVQSLERGVQKLYLRLEQRQQQQQQSSCLRESDPRKKRIQQVLRHVEHCWTQLQGQVAALTAGLECFVHKLLPSFRHHIASIQQQSCGPCNNSVGQQQSAARITLAIQHLFQWLIRLHDGYILTVSGECRHATDQDTARKSKFPSRLNVPNTRNTNSMLPLDHDTLGHRDGPAVATTAAVLYSPHKMYSGTSWDEWMDPCQGLRYRLHTLLRPYLAKGVAQRCNDFWDDWTEPGQPAALLEAIVGQTEHDMQLIQSEFTKLKHSSKFTNAVREALLQQPSSVSNNKNNQVTVTMSGTDNMEQLKVVSPWTGGKLVLERRANKFQIKGTSSVLPIAYSTAQDWEQGGMKWEDMTTTDPTLAVPVEEQNSHNGSSRKANARMVEKGDDTGVIKPQRKRRKIIADSSSSSGEEQGKNHLPAAIKRHPSIKTSALPVAAVGLVVKVTEATTRPPKVDLTQQCSVNSIKMQFGVNVSNMEASFDTLVAEEADATRAAELVDNSNVDEAVLAGPTTEEWSSMIHHAERLVKQRLRAMKRVVVDTDYYDMNDADTAIWNARELLREACMKAGDLILSTNIEDDISVGHANDQTLARPRRRKMILRAAKYFDDAQNLVAAQQKLHERMNHNPTELSSNVPDQQLDNVATIQYFRRNLLLLAGQAQTNSGIARIELVQKQCYSPRDAARKPLLETACQFLDAAITSARAMNEKSKQDAHLVGNNPSETRRDEIQSLQLESLALRWKAAALWHGFQKNEASALFHSAAALFEQGYGSATTMDSLEKLELLDTILDCRLESYHAMTTLADLATQSMRRATVAQISESPAFYDGLLDTVALAIRKAAQVSDSIKSDLRCFQGKYEELCEENVVMNSYELTQRLHDDKEWWKCQKASSTNKMLSRDTNTSVESLSRNDLHTNDSRLMATIRNVVPSGRYGRELPVRRRSKYNLGGYSNNRQGAPFRSDEPQIGEPLQPKPQQFRKWREDMAVDSATGKLVPKLEYPSIAPEMPPHIAALVAARRNIDRRRKDRPPQHDGIHT